MHAFIVEALLKGRFDDLEIRRDVEIARRVERRMADLQNLPTRRLVAKYAAISAVVAVKPLPTTSSPPGAISWKPVRDLLTA
jgi:hypothetical protein